MSKIEWGKGSAFNLGRIPGSDIRVERSNTPQGWCFLASNNQETYLHVDNRYFKTKQELDECILEWINEKMHTV